MSEATSDIEKKFLQMYDEHADAIFRHCYFRVFDRDLAKDLVQDTFGKTWQYMAQGKTIDSPKAFLYKVATNLIINNAQKKKAESLDALQEKGFDPGFDDRSTLDNMLAGKEVLAKLDEIDEKYSQIIIMRYIDDMSPKEIANIIKETENNVSVRLHRGIKKLRELIEEDAQV